MTKKNFSESEEQTYEAVQNEAYNEEFASEVNPSASVTGLGVPITNDTEFSEENLGKITGVVSTGGGLAKNPVGNQMFDHDTNA